VASGSYIADLDQFAVLTFAGPDAKTFLQGQLSCDVDPVAIRPLSTFGAYCSAKGRMLASFLLWKQGEEFHMLLSSSIAEAVGKRLSMFVLRAKVKIGLRTDVSLVGIGGPGAAGVLQQSMATIPSTPQEVVAGDLTVIALPGARWLLVFQRETTIVSIRTALIQVASVAWDWSDIRNGIAWITDKTQDQFVPQMLGIERLGGVSFKKGCYPGQEIVARTQYLGKLKRRMHLAHVNAVAEPGTELHSEDVAGQANGMIVNAAPAPDGGSDVLAVVQSDSAEHSQVHLGSPSGPVLHIQPLALLQP
jgi:folate-binding protein YgfZ